MSAGLGQTPALSRHGLRPSPAECQFARRNAEPVKRVRSQGRFAVAKIAGPAAVRGTPFRPWIFGLHSFGVCFCANIAATGNLMFRLFARAKRKRRAERYLQLHPEDVAAVGPILFALDRLAPKDARDVAEMRAGHRLSEAEWRKVSARWNRTWNAIR
jgi:hypothetical protein